jgi:hypothetical protein
MEDAIAVEQLVADGERDLDTVGAAAGDGEPR